MRGYLAFLLSASAYAGLFCRDFCDMENPENRKFDTYFGLEFNHFDYASYMVADGVTPLPFFDAVLPVGLMNIHSFYMYDCRGCGKSTIQAWQKSAIPEGSFFFSLDTSTLQKGIENFLATCPSKIPAEDCIKDKWSQEDFAELLLSGMITQFVKSYKSGSLKKSLLTRSDKIVLFKIFSYYSNVDGSKELEAIADDFFGVEWGTSGFLANKKLEAFDIEVEQYDKSLRRHVPIPAMKEIEDVSGLSKVVDKKRLAMNQLLYGALDRLHELHQTKKLDNPFFSIQSFSTFLQTAYGQKITVSIDGLDENPHFFKGAQIFEGALKAFVQSCTSQQFLSLLTHPYIKAYMFFPTIPSLSLSEFKAMVGRSDKYDALAIDWSPTNILNYGDFYFNDMRKGSRYCCCKTLPSFRQWVRSNETLPILEKIKVCEGGICSSFSEGDQRLDR